MNWMQRAVARKYEGSEDGFTLIELLVVILILGILSAIVVLSIGGFQGTGNKQACITTAKTTESAAAAYYSDHNAWPAGVSDLGQYLKSTSNKYALVLDGSGNVTGSNTAGCP